STEGRSIALQAQQMVIMVVRSDYRAVNDQARRSIYDWQSFLKAQQAGEVIPTGDHLDTSSVDCGPLVSLRELAKY
ncbi:MAG: hypothetical protein ACXVBW_03025, partial [Bdellovibrionota bacterium]